MNIKSDTISENYFLFTCNEATSGFFFGLELLFFGGTGGLGFFSCRKRTQYLNKNVQIENLLKDILILTFENQIKVK